MPIMRAMWLHYPDDPAAVARGDQYLWGRDILVAPVVEKGATSRRVYLPRGTWFDFWTEETRRRRTRDRRAVDLATMPLYVRAGAIIPMGPVRQYTDEPVDGPLTVTVYPGADGAFELFEDDGRSFEYRRGGWMGIALALAATRPPAVGVADARLADASAADARHRSPARRIAGRAADRICRPSIDRAALT